MGMPAAVVAVVGEDLLTFKFNLEPHAIRGFAQPRAIGDSDVESEKQQLALLHRRQVQRVGNARRPTDDSRMLEQRVLLDAASRCGPAQLARRGIGHLRRAKRVEQVGAQLNDRFGLRSNRSAHAECERQVKHQRCQMIFHAACSHPGPAVFDVRAAHCNPKHPSAAAKGLPRPGNTSRPSYKCAATL